MILTAQRFFVARFVLILTLLTGMIGSVPTGSVHAATLTVTNTNDSGAGSLRQAIIDAAPGDTISFAPSLAGGTITLGSNLVVNQNLTIDGSGLTPQATISGGNIVHAEVTNFAVVTVSDLTISDGYTSGSGGGIYSNGNLTLVNTTLRNNHAAGSGGAIYAPNLTLKNTTIYQNQANGSGGAIAIVGTSNSTIVNSTVNQNQAGGNGGAFFLQGSPLVEVINSTFTWNTAPSGTEIMLNGTGALSLSNTIFVCTPSGVGCILQLGNFSLNYGNSIIGTGSLSDYGLSELADNGGPTQTQALLAGSSLIDAGDDTICANTPVNGLDQRGVARSQGIHCDIGAFEYGVPPTPTPTMTSTPSPTPTPLRMISGGVGIGGATVNYVVNGTPKTVTSNSSGNYLIQVPLGWSGTVTPTKTNTSFSPANRSYSNVQTDLYLQNYLATLIVINSNDSGPGSLRQAIADSISGVTIGFDPALAGQTIMLASQLVVTKNLRIDGSGLEPPVSISGNHATRIFSVDAYYRLDLWSLILRDGLMSGTSYTMSGGAVYTNTYTLMTIKNVTFMGNTAYKAGAIYGAGLSEITILDSQFISNSSQSDGGAIFMNSQSKLRLENSLLNGNNAAYSGGAIVLDSAGTHTLLNNTFSDNRAGAGGAIQIIQTSNSNVTLRNNLFKQNVSTSSVSSGGAVYVSQSSIPSVLTFENNTFYANAAANIGGAIYSSGTATLRNNTFSNNQADKTGGSAGASLFVSAPADTSLANNIFANNIRGGECSSFGTTYTTGIRNLVEDGSGPCASLSGTIISDPILGALADNGGSTQTTALLSASPAINAGDSASCPSTDQRGVLRPQGESCDVGAYEYEGPFPPTPTPTQTFTPTATPTNTPTLTPTATSTPITNCNAVYHGPLTLNGGLSMNIINQTGLPLAVQDVFVIWNNDKGHSVGADKTLSLQQASLNGTSFWNGSSIGPSFVITPSSNLSIPTGNSTILFTFHQSYDLMDGSEQILINLKTNGCQSYPIDSNTISVTNTPTPTNTATFTPTATPSYSYKPLYLSLASSQTIGGVAAADEDILRFDGQNWSLFFDGSDVGVASPDLFGFSFLDSDSILMSFTANVTVNGITATPQDVLRFDATSLGTTTAGTWSLYFDGSDVGLDSSAEAIDSLTLLPDGRLLISTTGNPSVTGISGAADEDVIAFTPMTLGATTSGSWALYFDGSDVGLADSNNEDVDALDVTSNGNIYLSTLGDFAVNGLAGADEDVFVCVPSSIGPTTSCNYSTILYFDGSTWGLDANDVDAFNFLALTPPPITPTPNTPTPTTTASPTPTATFTRTPPATQTATKTSTPTVTSTPPASMSVQIVQPNGGEVLNVGSVYRITWNSTSDIDMVTIGYKSCDSCLDWIAYNIPNVGYYDWNVFVGNTINTQFKIYIIGYDTGVGSISDTSDNNFTVLQPTPTPTYTSTPTSTRTPTATPTATQTPTISILTFTPVEDAYVASGSPTTNYGSATTLQVDNSPIKHFLIKFNVSGLNGKQISSAKLRLYNVDAASKGGDFYAVNDTSWQEETITWNNAPAALTNLLASLGSVSANNWYEIDITSLITGDGAYSLRISSTSSDGADYSSKEGTNPLQLIITVH